ncbi:NAD-dependent epimerase/dehydratase family protein [Salinithrix halophila]|uniref:NAD-dependent epimerase/dehydratase family protein n=1 Tax=Salinithrix halophila TaxID=1485204 RepID=A0ABV8JFP2_9BACL
MKVLVTGGAGFIGSHIVDHLLEEGMEVVIVDNLTTGSESYLRPEASFYRLNIQDEGLMDVFREERPDAVIHQAGQSKVPASIEDPIWDAQTNILGTIRVLEGCRQYGVKKVVYASSAAVYGNPQYLPIDEEHPVQPLSPYGVSKYTPEHYLKAYDELYGIRYTVFRYANVYGVRQLPGGEAGVITILMNKLINGETFRIEGDGEQSRDFIYVEDIATANLSALKQGDGEILNIGTGKRTTLNELIGVLEECLGRKVETAYSPERPGDIKDSYFHNERVMRVLNWTPRIDLKTGLQRTYDYYRMKAEN